MRKICPKCKGGRSRELSMSLVGTPPLQVWKCWRNKCGHSESALGHTLQQTPTTPRRAPEVQELPEHARVLLEKKHGIEYETLFRHGVQWAPHYGHGRVAFPIWSPARGLRGYALRSYAENRVGPKTLTQFVDGSASAIRCGWYRTFIARPDEGFTSTVVLTEDAVSALRLSQAGITAVSLCGTQVGQDVILEVSQLAQNIICALDNDAIATAIFYTRRYGLRCLPLARDIKDQPPHEFEHTLRRIERLAERRS